MPESIGERLRRERSRCGLTLREVAEVVGVGQPHLSRIENGREGASDALLERLAVAYGADLDELMVVAGRLPWAVAQRMAERPAAAARYLRRFL